MIHRFACIVNLKVLFRNIGHIIAMIIFRQEVKLRVINRTAASRLLVAMDGQRNMVVTEGAPVQISIDSRTLSLAQRRDYSHYEVMRTKLKWSGGLLEKK